MDKIWTTLWISRTALPDYWVSLGQDFKKVEISWKLSKSRTRWCQANRKRPPTGGYLYSEMSFNHVSGPHLMNAEVCITLQSVMNGSSVTMFASAQYSVVSYLVHKGDKVRSRSKFHAFILQLPFVHTQLRRYHRSRSCTCLRKFTPGILRDLQIIMSVHLSLLGRSIRLCPCSTSDLGCTSDSYSVCICTFHFGLRLLAASVQLHPPRRQSSMLGQ